MSAQLSIFGGEPEQIRSFEQDYEGLVIEFAKTHRGKAFSSEDVTVEAVRRGILPSTDFRCTGSIYTRLAEQGVIRRSEAWFRRTFGNGTEAKGWVGV